MKKDGNKLPTRTQMAAEDEKNERPAKKVMKAIGQSLLKPVKKPSKVSKLKNGPSSQNNRKQVRQESDDMTKDAGQIAKSQVPDVDGDYD